MGRLNKTVIVEPIGVVSNDFEHGIPEDYENIASKIVLNDELSEALSGIEENSHIIVLFWMDRVGKEGRKTMKLHPKGRKDLPLLGVFATRSPNRANPIGIRAVRLIEREKNILKVVGLDALNGSPVLDLKPYSVKHDLVEDARIPWWAKHLRKREE